MKRPFDLIVVIPVGPASKPAWLLDTMESVRCYVKGSLKFILADDSQKQVAAEVKAVFGDIDILTVPKNLGKSGGLYISLAKAFLYAYEHYDFELLLRMDDDALVTGPEPHSEALDVIHMQPHVGLIGRHISGRFSPDCFGNVHDNYWPRKQLLKDTTTWKAIRRPIANMAMRSLMVKAFDNGYELGENIQGGAYFISRSCIEKLADCGLLPMARLQNVNLCEDHLFSLMAKVIGMDLYDLAGSGEPFGIAWKGLPASPATLLQTGKKIIHSIRFWQDQDEAEIRGYFKQQRSALAPHHEHEVKIRR